MNNLKAAVPSKYVRYSYGGKDKRWQRYIEAGVSAIAAAAGGSGGGGGGGGRRGDEDKKKFLYNFVVKEVKQKDKEETEINKSDETSRLAALAVQGELSTVPPIVTSTPPPPPPPPAAIPSIVTLDQITASVAATTLPTHDQNQADDEESDKELASLFRDLEISLDGKMAILSIQLIEWGRNH